MYELTWYSRTAGREEDPCREQRGLMCGGGRVGRDGDEAVYR